jgi:hypothetical protein
VGTPEWGYVGPEVKLIAAAYNMDCETVQHSGYQWGHRFDAMLVSGVCSLGVLPSTLERLLHSSVSQADMVVTCRGVCTDSFAARCSAQCQAVAA